MVTGTDLSQDPSHAGTGARAEREWYLVALAGIANLAVGVLVLAYPSPSLDALALILGVNLLAVGASMIVRGFAEGGHDREPAPTVILAGMLALIAGLIVIRHPGGSVTVVALAFAIYLIVAGALDLSRAFIQPGDRMSSLLRGVIRIAGGTLIMSWPELDVETLAVVAGIALCLHAAADLREAYALRARGRSSA